MGTASQIPARLPEPGVSKVTGLFRKRQNFLAIRARLLEEGAIARKPLPPTQARELNDLLWVALNSNSGCFSEISRLVRAGANPNSAIYRVEREIVECEC